MIRRLYKRTVTTERIVINHNIEHHGPVSGESFRVDVIKKDGETETVVFTRNHSGSIEVEETADGNFRLNGTVVTGKLINE